jgi:ATP-binding cassette subfamily F protein uup
VSRRSRGRASRARHRFERLTARKRTFREERELAGLPLRIAMLEAEQEQLRGEMSAADFYKASPDRIREVMARLETSGHELDEALTRWIELEEK